MRIRCIISSHLFIKLFLNYIHNKFITAFVSL